MVETLASLRKLTRGTPIKVTKANSYTDNVKISGAGFDPIYKQVGGNVGISATEIIKARVAIYKKDKK